MCLASGTAFLERILLKGLSGHILEKESTYLVCGELGRLVGAF